MGRIDDALSRLEGSGIGRRHADGGRDPFTSAWDAGPSDRTAQLAAEPQAEPAPAPAVPSLLSDLQSSPFQGFNRRWIDRLIVAENPNIALVEQFRGLAAMLHRIQVDGSPKIVMLTSASPGEGKTLTALNLALMFSESYRRRVLLIDADLRRPSIREIADISDRPGLSEGLKAKADKKLSVIPLTDRLMLLPAGSPDPDPMSGLTSSRMRRILDEAAARFDWVILDAPPVGPVADASLLAEMADAALLVIRAGRTAYPEIQKAIDAVGRNKVLGVVLNGVESQEFSPYYVAGYAPRSDGLPR